MKISKIIFENNRNLRNLTTVKQKLKDEFDYIIKRLNLDSTIKNFLYGKNLNDPQNIIRIYKDLKPYEGKTRKLGENFSFVPETTMIELEAYLSNAPKKLLYVDQNLNKLALISYGIFLNFNSNPYLEELSKEFNELEKDQQNRPYSSENLQTKFYKKYNDIINTISENPIQSKIGIDIQKEDDNQIRIIAFNPTLMWQKLFEFFINKLFPTADAKKTINIRNDNKFSILEFIKYNKQDEARLLDIILGMVELNKIEYMHGAPCYNAWQTSFAAASDGYGPLIYSLAASYVKKKEGNYNKITSDRSSVSPEARNVWKKTYLDRNDYDIYELDNINLSPENRKTPNFPDDDCILLDLDQPLSFYLNYAYEIETPLNFESLQEVYEISLIKISEKLKNLLFSSTPLEVIQNFIKKLLFDLRYKYFTIKYRRGS